MQYPILLNNENDSETNTRGGERNPNLFIKNRVFIIAYLNFCHLPSTLSPCDAIHLEDVFFHSSEQFLNSLILMTFSASAVFFVSPLPHCQNVSL